jgi:hypothetical protein
MKISSVQTPVFWLCRLCTPSVRMRQVHNLHNRNPVSEHLNFHLFFAPPPSRAPIQFARGLGPSGAKILTLRWTSITFKHAALTDVERVRLGVR